MTIKRWAPVLCCVLAGILLMIIGFPEQQLENTVTFYYARSQFAYGTPDGVIGSEQREIGGHENDLYYLLALYLEGPMKEDLKSPLPGKSYVKILNINKIGDALHIKLSDLSSVLTDSEFALGCACLTKTCLEITNAQAVQIQSGNRTIRMNPATMQFYDESTSVLNAEREETK